MIYTWLRPGHLSVHVGDSSRRCQEIVKILIYAFEYNWYYYCYYYYYYYFNIIIVITIIIIIIKSLAPHPHLPCHPELNEDVESNLNYSSPVWWWLKGRSLTVVPEPILKGQHRVGYIDVWTVAVIHHDVVVLCPVWTDMMDCTKLSGRQDIQLICSN